MGKYGFSSWTLHMASIILFSTMWGFALREWLGSSPPTRRLVWTGVGALVASTMIIGVWATTCRDKTVHPESDSRTRAGCRILFGCRSAGRQPDVAAIDRFVPSLRLEVFTRAAIECILGIQIGARGFGGRHAPTMKPAATKGGDPSGTYKRWFGRVSGRAG
jgi:hypothetical protein